MFTGSWILGASSRGIYSPKEEKQIWKAVLQQHMKSESDFLNPTNVLRLKVADMKAFWEQEIHVGNEI
ncbi:conserved hypothetical protein [Ricinus communis]|uniref:Uncharacterized protein n=1 Tax=Ricinus communis TaxID=3988 RepID=B9S8N6_RICCO|nr:conserved hypothetical protein [Ricinus communis]